MYVLKSNLNSRDRDLLYFLWKWRVGTTAALSRAVYSTLSAPSAYTRLWQLERSGFIVCDTASTVYCHLWTLTRRGFEQVKPLLPALRESGHKSENLKWDLVTSAIHLGNFLRVLPSGVALFSAQELRRLSSDFIPSWVPLSERHRPDGYWYVPIGHPMATVALEVELTRRRELEYEMIADFYASELQVIRVLWLTACFAASQTLHSKLAVALRGRPMIHNSVSYPAFVDAGWDALIEYGPEKGKPIGFLLKKIR